jgi:hypothetical protein
MITLYAINTDYKNLRTEKEGFTRHIAVEVSDGGDLVYHEINSKEECENLIQILQTLSLKCWGTE